MRTAAAVRLFGGTVAGELVDRPNRYLVRARVGGRTVSAYCPNPGRLAELLLPGAPLLLERAAGARRTRYTAVAVRRRSGEVTPLYAARSNDLAAALVLPRLFPEAVAVRREARLGASRLDFAVDLPGSRQAFLEVKTCTLVERGVAMFPDAPTDRGLRHIEELASLNRDSRAEGHALFVLMGRETERMVPNVHTDPAFAFGLLRLERRLGLHAVAVGCDASGRARVVRFEVPVDLDPVRRLAAAGYSARRQGGAYLLIVTLLEPRSLGVGGLGRLVLPRGSYVYVGSAMASLGTRVARHLRRRKRAHWHIDHLAVVADRIEALPVVSTRRLECDLAREVASVADGSVRGFGCSDCSCDSHLFRFDVPPTSREAFVDVVLRFRHEVALEG